MTRTWKTILLLGIPISLLILMLTVWAVLNSQAFHQYVKEQVVLRLEGATGGKASLESLQIRFFPLRLLVSNLKIQSRDLPEPPFLMIRSAEILPGIESLSGIPILKKVVLHEPQLAIEVRSDGSTNIPKPRPAGDKTLDLFHVLIGTLDIEKGSLQFRQNRTGFSTHVEGIALYASYQVPAERYRAELSYEKGRVRVGERVWDYSLAAHLNLLRDEVEVERLVASTPQSKLEAQGRIRNFASPEGEISYQGALHLSDARNVYPEIRDLQGALRVKGSLSFSGKGWNASGALEGTKLSVNGSKIERFAGQYNFRPERLQVEKISVAGLHGRAEGSFAIESPFQDRRYAADVRFSEIGVLDLVLLARIDRARFAGQASGSLKANWRDDWRDFSAEGNVAISESPGEIQEHALGGNVLPISGQLHFALSESSFRFYQSFLKLGQSHVQFVGTVSTKGVSNLRFEARSEALSDFAFLAPEIQGRGSLVGVIEGTRENPTARGSFLVENLRYQKFSLDQGNGRFEADRRTIHLVDAELIQRSSRVLVRGQVFVDPARLVPTGELHLLISLKEALMEDLWTLVGQTYPASGRVSADFMAAGRYPQIALEGSARVGDGQFLGQPYSSGHFEIDYHDSLLQLPKLAIQIGPGHIQGSAQIDLKKETIQTKLNGAGIPLEEIQWVSVPASPISGRLSKLEIAAEGSYRRPALQGQIEVTGLAIAGEPVGDFLTKFDTESQKLRFQTDSLTPAVDLKAAGTIDLNEDLDCVAQVSFKNLALTQYVKKLLPVAPGTISSQAEGQLVLSGPLRYWERLVINGKLQSLQISFQETQLQTSQPFEIEVRDERVNIQNALFTGKGTLLHLDGLLDLSRKQRLDFNLRGDLDLALLGEFVKKLSAGGQGTVNATIRGTLSDPSIQGQARISDGQFTYADLPNSFSQVNGNLFFDEDQVKIDNLTAVSGGGRVQASGDVVFGDEQIKLMNLRIQGHEVRVRYPEGMRNVLNADLTLHGSQRAQTLSGTIQILSASFQKGHDPITRFLEERNRQISVPAAKQLGETLSLDLTLTSDRNIRLDTSLIKMTSRADLKVKGTVGSPLVTGSIEASGGELYFQGVRYRITRGRLEFLNPVRIDPRIDLEAEADMRDYRVVLTINGTADKFRADLRSDPPLSTVDLLSMVALSGTGSGGSSSSWRSLSPTGPQQQSSLAAASLLSEGLSMQMGSRVKRIFGIDRFRIDPFLVGNERDPSARVTFGQQVTRDLSITYSTSVSTNEQQVILVEYNLSDKMSVIASRDADGAFGLDVRFRKRLRQKNR
jgi:hypothetical protein